MAFFRVLGVGGGLFVLRSSLSFFVYRASNEVKESGGWGGGGGGTYRKSSPAKKSFIAVIFSMFIGKSIGVFPTV